MGKRSVKADKNIYQLSREEAELTRDQASEKMEFVSSDKIEKIESEKTSPRPEEVLAMAECYNKPALSNYYCSHECPIGRKYVPEVEIKDLSQITLEALSTLNALEKEKTRFIDIAADNKISDAEKQDFATIQEKLEKISMIADSLRLWMEQQSQA